MKKYGEMSGLLIWELIMIKPINYEQLPLTIIEEIRSDESVHGKQTASNHGPLHPKTNTNFTPRRFRGWERVHLTQNFARN